MTEAEYLELIQLTSDGTVGHVMNAISIIFAYLVAVFFAGNKLNRFQVISVTTIYSAFFFVFSLASVIGTMTRFVTLRNQFASEYTQIAEIYGIRNSDPVIEYGPVMMFSLMMLGWVLSILFMLNIRKTKSLK
jgi:hypothetical protein